MLTQKSTALLEAHDVTKNFGGLRAISQVSFEIHAGEIFSIIGPNGAGKTTLFNLVAGCLPVSGGAIFFKGQRISGLKPHRIVDQGIARTFQLTALFENNTVYENLLIGQKATRAMTFARGIFGGPGKHAMQDQAMQRTEELIDFLGLSAFRDQPAAILPQLARKQLSIGLALATSPELILLDEPAGGVNIEEIGALIDLIGRIRDQGVTVCLIEHKMSVVMNISDRILAMSYGEKVGEGTPAEICSNAKVIQSYLGDKYVTRQSN